MSKHIQETLLKFDEWGRYEFPSDFNYAILYEKVLLLKQELDATFKAEFLINDQIQDASFFCDIKVPDILIKNYRNDLLYSIRISNFGNLATINFEEKIIEEAVAIIKIILIKLDFIFISYDDLDIPYDGKFEAFKNILNHQEASWYTRYFDYL
jgi:hypothetical protein